MRLKVLEMKIAILFEEMKHCKDQGHQSSAHAGKLWQELNPFHLGIPKEDLFGGMF